MNKLPPDIFVNLNELRLLEKMAGGFSFLARKQRVKSILGGKHTSKLRGRGLDFEEVRAYTHGDDIRNIDWKVTARTKKTHTKVFTEEKERPVFIVVDQSASMFFGSRKYTKSVVAAKLAALAAFRVIKDGDRIGGMVFGNNNSEIILPKRDRKNIMLFLHKIEEMNHELKNAQNIEFSSALKNAIIKINNIVTHDFLVLIISDFMRYHPDTIKSIISLAKHNNIMLAKITDPIETFLPEEKIIAGNSSKQILLNGKSSHESRNYSSLYHSRLQEFENKMKQYRIPLLNFNTYEEVDSQLKEILKSKNR